MTHERMSEILETMSDDQLAVVEEFAALMKEQRSVIIVAQESLENAVLQIKSLQFDRDCLRKELDDRS